MQMEVSADTGMEKNVWYVNKINVRRTILQYFIRTWKIGIRKTMIAIANCWFFYSNSINYVR